MRLLDDVFVIPLSFPFSTTQGVLQEKVTLLGLAAPLRSAITTFIATVLRVKLYIFLIISMPIVPHSLCMTQALGSNSRALKRLAHSFMIILWAIAA